MEGGRKALKKQIFGKEIELKTEVAVIAVSILILLGCLVGYIFFRDKSDIIIEARHGAVEETGDGIGAEGKLGAGSSDNALDAGKANKTGEREEETDTKGIEDTDGSEANNDNGEGNNNDSDEKLASGEMIKVYVVGCVKSPGIVTIEKGQMIYDAVALAGGLTEEADAKNINMVYRLNENVMLYIKSIKEAEQTRENIKGENAVIVKGSGDSALVIDDGGGDDKNDQETKPGLVNINTADIAELDTLPGIGEATAKDIIAFREKNNGFRRIEDIMKVPRIKQNRFDKIRDFITVE